MSNEEKLFKSEKEQKAHVDNTKKKLDSQSAFLSDKEIKNRKNSQAFNIYKCKRNNSSSRGQNFNRRGNTRGR